MRERTSIKTLSVIIPCYNEEKTVGEVLQRITAANLGVIKKEVIVVNDGSTDNSASIIKKYASKVNNVHYFEQSNKGKGAAVRRGISQAQGDAIIIQDADLEYNPLDWRQMLPLFELPDIKVVFGSRRLLLRNHHSGLGYFLGAEMINLFTNLLYGKNVSDQFTCYKMFRRTVLLDIPLHTKGFEFDAELVAKIFRLNHKIYTVPITYSPRTREEGKKIRVRHGLAWLWQIIKHRFSPINTW